MKTPDPQDRLWAAEAAKYLNLSRSTLAKWRMRREGPPFHHCGPRLIYYVRQEIDAWLTECDRAGRSSAEEPA
jgi:predicted DNA-binding transcriptional regulator AlpA